MPALDGPDGGVECDSGLGAKSDSRRDPLAYSVRSIRAEERLLSGIELETRRLGIC